MSGWPTSAERTSGVPVVGGLTPGERRFGAWRDSIARSVQVMKSLGAFVVEKGAADKITKAFNRAILDAATAEMACRTASGEFDGPLDEGAVRKDLWPARTGEVVRSLLKRGWVERSCEVDGARLFKRDGETVMFDRDKEWVWRDRDATRAGDSLRELQHEILKED